MMAGVMGSSLPARSSRMMTMVRPAGARFFWAPAKITPYLLTSMGRERMSEDMSQARGTLPVSGTYCHWVPSMVLLEQ